MIMPCIYVGLKDLTTGVTSHPLRSCLDIEGSFRNQERFDFRVEGIVKDIGSHLFDLVYA